MSEHTFFGKGTTPGTGVEPATEPAAERVHVDHEVAKRLGNWTGAGTFEIKARRGTVVVDLRSPRIPDEVEVRIGLQRAVVKLLVPEDATVEYEELRWSGRGRVKDSGRATGSGSPVGGGSDGGGSDGSGSGRRIRLVGSAADGEIRVHRGGVAVLSAMFSRAYVDDLRRARQEGRLPTVDDPTRDPFADPHRRSA